MRKKIRFRYTPKTRVSILVISIVALALNYLFFFNATEAEMDYAMIDFYENYPLLDTLRVYGGELLYGAFTLLPVVGLIIVIFYKPSAAADDNPRRGLKRSRHHRK